MSLIIWLALWLVPALTLARPLRLYVFDKDQPSWACWSGGVFTALLWPWCVFMLLRKALLTRMVGDQ